MDKVDLISILEKENLKDLEEFTKSLTQEDLHLIMYHSSDPRYADNCAKIFTSLDYSRCEKYFDDLFSWIEDLNRIGAYEIFEYLAKAPGSLILPHFKRATDAGIKRDNKNMLCFLKMLVKENLELYSLIKNDDILKRLKEKTEDR
ncbi:MAG: hypothetical protein IJA82_08050 [Clostridia bacterium]|nr:hypothetical protein [Clostridia bacterium]